MMTPTPTTPTTKVRARRLRPWFDGRQMIRRIPKEAIRECSAPGPADDAVAYWVRTLAFSAPPDLAREYLQGCGAWEAEDLQDDAVNLARLFWIACCNEREDPGCGLYLDR